MHPHKAPWEGEEGKDQQRLGVRNACALARNFIAAGFNVIILDVLQDETALSYKNELNGIQTQIVLLLPTLKEIKQRNEIRGKRITDDELKMVYEWQKLLTIYDLMIDNTIISDGDVVQQLLELFRD